MRDFGFQYVQVMLAVCFQFVLLHNASAGTEVSVHSPGMETVVGPQITVSQSEKLQIGNKIAVGLTDSERYSLHADGFPLSAYLNLSETAKIISEAAAESSKDQTFGAASESQSQLRTFRRIFDEAHRPNCLQQNGLKYQPTGVGPIAITGIYALPFILVAKLREVCG